MPFSATVVRVLIASPSDTAAARQALREALEDWNGLHAENDGVMVLPLMWERDATPEMTDRPQGVINRQLVDAADMLVGVFWTRLGTPTSEAESGTAEEIERLIEAGKPVLLYFSSEPVAPDIIEADQHSRLVAFGQALEKRGLVDRFSTTEDLRRKASAAMTRTIRDRFAIPFEPGEATDMLTAKGPRARLVANVNREREVRGFSRAGKPQYTTRKRLVIENRGSDAAENLTFQFESPAGAGEEPPTVFKGDEAINKLAPGGVLEYPLMTHGGTANQWDIVFRWSEDDSQYEDRNTLR